MRHSARVAVGVTAAVAAVAATAATAVSWDGSAGSTAAAGTAATTQARWGQGPAGHGNGQGFGQGQGYGQGQEQAASGAISEATAADLAYMVEEEKLAHDVYVALGERYDARQLDRIARSETTHQQAVRRLLERYELSDPTLGADPGEFSDPTLQALYDDLVAQGSQSLAAAAEVGITIERTDIADLDRAIAATSAPDVVRVLESLRDASVRHLAAFERLAATAG